MRTKDGQGNWGFCSVTNTASNRKHNSSHRIFASEQITRECVVILRRQDDVESHSMKVAAKHYPESTEENDAKLYDSVEYEDPYDSDEYENPHKCVRRL